MIGSAAAATQGPRDHDRFPPPCLSDHHRPRRADARRHGVREVGALHDPATGKEVPCLTREAVNAPKATPERQPPTVGDRLDEWTQERARRHELETLTGATTCKEVATRYGRLGTFGPLCETAEDCGWAQYTGLTCGKAVHKDGVVRGEELKELDRLLECPRKKRSCRPVRHRSTLTCQEGRCGAVKKPKTQERKKRARIAALQAETGARSCAEVKERFGALYADGPDCQSAADCGWFAHSRLSCRTVFHTASLERAAALEALDALLGCVRPLRKCKQVLGRYDVSCRESRCGRVSRR